MTRRHHRRRRTRRASDRPRPPRCPATTGGAGPPAGCRDRDAVEHGLDPSGDGMQDPAGVDTTGVGRRDHPQPLGRGRGADVSPQRYAVPRDERELRQGCRRTGQVPVEHTGHLVAIEADVVRRDVVVPDERGLRDREVPPGAGMPEAGDGPVEGGRPRHHRGDLAQREQLDVDVDHPAGQVLQDLAPLPVEAEHPRDVGEPGRQVREERVDGRRPRSGRAPDGVADPYRAAEVAARQPLLDVLSHCPAPGRRPAPTPPPATGTGGSAPT